MTVTPGQLALYAGALVVLFPVWVALTARALSVGFDAASVRVPATPR